MPTIETPNLILTPYAAADAPAMAALHGNAQVMDFMKDGKTLDAAEAAATFARYLDCWQRAGHGIFAIRERVGGTFIGECGHWLRPDKPGVSMRFLLLPEYWGRGLGWEMNAAATRWLFTETDVMSFWAVTQARNKGAVAILRRLGGVVTEERHMDRDGLWLFDVTRPAWAEARASEQEE